MSNLNKILLAAAITLSVFSLLVSQNVVSPSLGSVSQASEYKATSTKKVNGGAGVQNLTVLKSEGGTLGSVVITGAGAGTINLYDATSTVTNAEWATTTIAQIPVSAAAGTYTFDISFYKGLIIEIIGTAPTSTITFR